MADNSALAKQAEAQSAVQSMGDKPLNLQHLSMNQLRYLGAQMANSGMFPDAKAGPTALVKILAGQEIGMPPFQAMTNIHIIQGKATMSANLMAAKVKGSGRYDYKLDLTSDSAKVTMIQIIDGKREEAGSFTYTMEDAQRAGLVKPGSGWTKYPQNMLFARAISTAVRMYAPDVFNGNTVYSPDEMGAAVDADGNYIDGETIDTPQPTPAPVQTDDTKDEPVENETEHPDEPEEIENTEDESEDINELLDGMKQPELIATLRAAFAEHDVDDVETKVAYFREIIDKDRPTTNDEYKTVIKALREMK